MELELELELEVRRVRVGGESFSRRGLGLGLVGRVESMGARRLDFGIGWVRFSDFRRIFLTLVVSILEDLVLPLNAP